MKEFSWLFSVIIPMVSSFPAAFIAYLLGIRKEKNAHHNKMVEQLNNELDAIYKVANELFSKEYNDEDFHHILYRTDDFEVKLEHFANNDLAKFDFLNFRRILTDHIFYKKDDKTVMANLSRQIQIIKRNLKHQFF